MPPRKQDRIQRYEQTKLRKVQDVTYEDDDTDIEVPNAIMTVVADVDVPVMNRDEAKPEMVNENEEKNDE
jgi:uncharacterized membrane protein